MQKHAYFLAALLLLLSLCALASCAPAIPTPFQDATDSLAATAQAIAKPAAADFSLPALSGADIQLSNYNGKVVVLNFWASWCAPCQAEMNDLETYYQNHKDQDFVIIGINLEEDADVVAAFVEAQKVTFPIALDNNAKVGREYGISGMPTTFFVDRDGSLLGYWPGAVSYAMLEETLSPLLEK